MSKVMDQLGTEGCTTTAVVDWRNTVPEFSLLDDAWIDVIDGAGRPDTVSMSDLFSRAHELKDIDTELPTQRVALLRVILACAHRAFGVDNDDVWESLWNAGHFPAADFDAYAGAVHHRFELFGQTPFFQVADLRSPKTDLSKMLSHAPPGLRPAFTRANGAALKVMTPAEAAVWLIHSHAYDVAGIHSPAAGDPEVKNGKTYGATLGWCGYLLSVLADGANVFETIMFNLVPSAIPGDVPAWEREPDTYAYPDREPTGPLDLLTWQGRRMRLLADGAGQVTGVVMCKGTRIYPQNMHRLEMHSAWRFSKPQSDKAKSTVHMPAMVDPSRAAWRLVDQLLLTGENDRPKPGVIEHLGDLTERLLDENRMIWVRTVGMVYGQQSAVVDEVVSDQIIVPLAAMHRRDLAALIESGVSELDAAAYRIGLFGVNLAEACGLPPAGHDDPNAPLKVFQANAFTVLDPIVRRWLASLSSATEVTSAREELQAQAYSALLRLLDDHLTLAPPSAWHAKHPNDPASMTAGVAYRIARAGLHRVLVRPSHTVTSRERT
jgi:CRISPR system Cascade subunit CasA